MNSQERDLLQSFLREVSQTRPSRKDPVADSLIQSALAAHPDALYLLAQRALAAETALKIQAGQAHSAASQPAGPGPGLSSFLGTATGVAAGVVAGSFLLEGVQAVFRESGLQDNISEGLDNLGDIIDWA